MVSGNVGQIYARSYYCAKALNIAETLNTQHGPGTDQKPATHGIP